MSGTRRGFTVLELLVAIVVAGIVATLIYGAAGAAADVQQRLSVSHDALQSQRALRATLFDALRNARPPQSYNDTVFTLENRSGGGGRPADRLFFVTAGVLPPLTSDADWDVSIEATPTGLVIVAAPQGFAQPSRVLARVPGITGLDVRVLPASGRSWTDDWPQRNRLPRAVELTFLADTGVVGPPMHVLLPAGGER